MPSKGEEGGDEELGLATWLDAECRVPSADTADQARFEGTVPHCTPHCTTVRIHVCNPYISSHGFNTCCEAANHPPE